MPWLVLYIATALVMGILRNLTSQSETGDIGRPGHTAEVTNLSPDECRVPLGLGKYSDNFWLLIIGTSDAYKMQSFSCGFTV